MGFRNVVSLLLLVAVFASSSVAEAAVLCASRLGHVRVRERCQRHETRVDLSVFGETSDPVPLQNWAVGTGGGVEGLESVAAAPDATMINLTPCRLIDTRPGMSSALAGDDIGPLASFEIRTYTLTGFCGVPAGATALSINLAVVPGVDSGFVSVGPTGSIAAFPPGPNFASINFEGAAFPISNSLIVPLDDMGRFDVYAARSADVIIDTNGYFQPKDAGTNVFFVPGTDTPAANGAALLAVVAEVNALSAGTRVVIDVGPGEFDLGGDQLNIDRPTALRGAGQELTSITSSAAANSIQFSGGADGSSIRYVSVENTNVSANAEAVFFIGAGGSAVRDVALTTAGGAGVNLNSSPDTVVERVTIDSESTGVFAGSGTTSAVIRDSTIASSDGFAVSGITGISIVVRNSTLSAGSMFSSILGTQSGAAFDVRHSHLSGPGSFIDGSGSLTMTHTFVDAGATSFAGTASCTATTTPGAFLETTCP